MKAKPVSKAKPKTKSTPKEKKASAELDDDALGKVSGGKVRLSDFHFTKKVDKASPVLFQG